MRLISVAHTGFTVQDLDRSIAFYRDLLGMQLIHQRDTTEPYVGQVTGFPKAYLKIALLKLGPEDPHTLELLQYVSHPGEPTDRAMDTWRYAWTISTLGTNVYPKQAWSSVRRRQCRLRPASMREPTPSICVTRTDSPLNWFNQPRKAEVL